MKDAAQLEKLCLSQDHLCVGTPGRPAFWMPKNRLDEINRDILPRLQADGADRSSAYIFSEFVPRLKAAGVTSADIETIFADNPRRLLCGSSQSADDHQRNSRLLENRGRQA